MSKPMIPVSKTELIKEWDFERNNEIGLDPEKLTTGMLTKAYWKCRKCGYTWRACIQNRVKNKSGCRVCKGLKILAGYNDLMTKNPELMAEWDFIKNNALGLFPYAVGPGTIRKAWWKCPNGHPSYYASISSRARSGTGCAVCKNKRVLSGVNDLATTRPELLEQWNYERNNELGITPNSVTEVSGKKVWWKCRKGHEWEATIAHISYGRGCPHCNSGKSTSFPEQAIFYYLKWMDKDCVNRYKLENRELDIYIPSKNVGIEYNGYKWHNGKEKQISDHLKSQYFEDRGIKVLHIIEIDKKGANFGSDCIKDGDCYYVNDDDIVGLEDVISQLISDIFSEDTYIDIERDRQKIYASYIHNEEAWSFATEMDSIPFKWDYERNSGLRPEHVSRRSGKKVYWLCPKGHSFVRDVHSISHSKCPACAKEEQYNNRFELTHPELLDEWDYEKNINISPEEITYGSGKKIWWKCKEGHPSWCAPITNRLNGCGCPICGRRKMQQRRYKRVAQYDLNGTFIKEWEGISVAEKELGIRHISSVCNGHRNKAGGFIWKYI